jgi:hypothetical protein
MRCTGNSTTGIALPNDLMASLASQEPFPAEPVEADLMEDAWPDIVVFPPCTDLLRKPSTAGEEVNGPQPKVACERVTPPLVERVSIQEFDALEADGAFVAVHERLFLHEHRKTRIGAMIHLHLLVLWGRTVRPIAFRWLAAISWVPKRMQHGFACSELLGAWISQGLMVYEWCHHDIAMKQSG